MKIFLTSLFIILVLISCSTETANQDQSNAFRNEVIEIAKKYVSDKFTESKVTTESNGIVSVSDDRVDYILKTVDNSTKYIIDPAMITTGLINEDEETDAVIVISSSKGQYLQPNEILILTGKDGNLILNRVIESDMKILRLKERVITAEITTKSRNSPLRDCTKCKEIVKYRFRNGDLVKAE